MTNSLDELVFDSPRALVRAWLLLAVSALGVSVLCAAALVAARTPVLGGWLPAHAFGHALVLHVDLATLVWFLACAAGLWSLKIPSRRVPLVWVAWAISTLGAIAMLLGGLVLPGQPVLSNYVPMVDHPVFLGGLVWFGTGVVATAVTGLRFRSGADYRALEWAKLPLLMAVAALVHAALHPAGQASAAVLEAAVWGAGHLLQFAYVVVMLFAWMVLAEEASGSAVSGRLRAWIFAFAATPVLAMPVILVSAGGEPHATWLAYSELMKWGSWPAATLAAVAILAAKARTPRVACTPESLALSFSIALFAIGCVSGAAIRAETTIVPAHYHGTIGAVTMALMALCYRALPSLGSEGVDPRRAKLQLGVYGFGLIVLIAGLAWGGALGAPRKSPFGMDGASVASISAASLVGLGGTAAVLSALAFSWMFLRRALAGLLASAARYKTTIDVRRRALMLTTTAVAVLGAGLSWLPDRTGWEATDRSGKQDRSAAEHATRKREAEVRVRFEQGVLMLHAKQFDPAIAAFHRVLELAPEMPEAHANMGFALLGLRRFEAARDFFDSATDLRRDQINAYFGLALALEGLNDLPGAVGAMRAYLHRALPDDPFRAKAQSALDGWQLRLSQR